MPPRGYRSVTLREEVYRELEALAREKGLTSINDAVRLLLEYRSIHSKLEQLLQARGHPARGRRRVRRVAGLVSPERFFQRAAEKEGAPLLWAKAGNGGYCYTPLNDALQAVEEANTAATTPQQAHGYLKELEECGLARYNPETRKWEITGHTAQPPREEGEEQEVT